MMHAAEVLPESSPTSLGRALPTEPSRFGALRDSNAWLGSPERLRERLEEDGYLYLRDFIPREAVAAARLSILENVRRDNPDLFDPAYPLIDAVIAPDQLDAFALDAKPTFRSASADKRNPDRKGAFRPDLAVGDEALRRVIFGPELESFYASLFGAPVRHFDYIWLRLMGPGPGTPTHCDWVYMGRGSRELLTGWIPYGDIPLDVGGLMVLEGSHKFAPKLQPYLERDVDSYCVNREEERVRVAVEGGWSHQGWLSDRPDLLPDRFSARWLTAPEWRMGDFITFKMTTVHGSLDNRSNRVRISSDTRWQPADQPIDDRWIGDAPVGHSLAGKRGRIC